MFKKLDKLMKEGRIHRIINKLENGKRKQKKTDKRKTIQRELG